MGACSKNGRSRRRAVQIVKFGLVEVVKRGLLDPRVECVDENHIGKMVDRVAPHRKSQNRKSRI